MNRQKTFKALILLFLVLFSHTCFAKSQVKRWRPFPNLSLNYGTGKISISSFRGNLTLVLVGSTNSGSFTRLKNDLAESSAFLAKNEIKAAMVLLDGSKVEEDFAWPYFLDKGNKFRERFMDKNDSIPYYYFLDKRGRVALEKKDIHGGVLDIAKIVHIYEEFVSRKVKSLNIQYGSKVRAPEISLHDIDGVPFKLSDYKGKKSVLVVFFSIDCSFCKREMPLLAALAKKPNSIVVGICSSGTKAEIKSFIAKYGVNFRILKDSSRSAFIRYKSTTTPESFVIDRDGFISYKHTGASGDLKDILDFEMDKAMGISNPGRLEADRYVGARVCRTCHQREYEQALGTPHSSAFSSLVKPESKKHYENKECLKCHVTGFGKEKGYTSWRTSRFLIGVQCEVCHGPGGEHGKKNKEKKTSEDYKKICLGCHTDKYRLKFSIEEAYKAVNHSSDEDLSIYPEEVKQKMLKARKKAKQRKNINLGVSFVGNSKCIGCHKREYDTWSKTKHAHAFESLVKERKSMEPQCLKCHSTGFGEFKGGFVNKNKTPDRANVGCEVCHGAGGDHIKAKTKDEQRASIFGLVGKCKYCVIQGMCQTCHTKEGSNCPAKERNAEFDIDKYLSKVTH